MLAGTVEHQDSLGNRGVISSGDVQWMTAGSGILHQEMPRGDAEGRMHGFQLWSNLPASLKMTRPRYQDVKAAEIPEVTDDDGTKARIVVGEPRRSGVWSLLHQSTPEVLLRRARGHPHRRRRADLSGEGRRA